MTQAQTTVLNSAYDALLEAHPNTFRAVLTEVLSRLTPGQRDAINRLILGDQKLSDEARNAIFAVLTAQAQSPEHSEGQGPSKSFINPNETIIMPRPVDPLVLFKTGAKPEILDRIEEWTTERCDLTLPLTKLLELNDQRGRGGHEHHYFEIISPHGFRMFTSFEMALEGTLCQDPLSREHFAQINQISFAENNRTYYHALIAAMPILESAHGSFKGSVAGWLAGQNRKGGDPYATYDVQIENGRLLITRKSNT